MKGKDYKRNIDIYDEEIDRLQEILTNMDPLTEDYDELCDKIKKLNESKLLEHKCYTEWKEHLIPEAVPKLFATLVSGLLIARIYRGEMSGMVINAGASALLNKIPKF